MPDAESPTPFRATLISTPWALFNRPSLQLAALKAYLEREMDAEIETCHLYLDLAAAIGCDTYRHISEAGWAGEALFAPLVFPERHQQAARVFRQSLRKTAGGRRIPDFDDLVRRIDETCRDWLAGHDFVDTRLVGFSVCFNQLLPSLYLAGLIGERGDGPAIVFGGSSCAGRIGQSLLRQFPRIDYVIDGEGERPLLGLCAYLDGHSGSLPKQVGGRIPVPTAPCPQIEVLNHLPLPDFAPYFARMATLFPALPFIPVLPLEFSRGCWWNRCAFCNLNLQWQGYRYKTAERLLAEVETLARRHQCLDFTFTDNALPQAQADLFFKRRGESAEDCRFFAEIRGTTRPEQLEIYSRGGLQTIQVGIESLSTSLLRKMVKGVTAIENIAMMKFSHACGIRLEGNLILEFPGSTLEEVGETMENLDYVLPFRPLATAVFFLGHGSPVHRNPGVYGISGIRPHKKNRALFPPELLGDLEMLTMDYRGGQADQRRLWRPVIGKIALWRRFHEGRGESSQPALGYRDGGSFLIIRQELADGLPLQHRLRGLSRDIYLFCGRIRTRMEILQQFPALSAAALDRFLSKLRQKRLLFQEDEQVLALAVHQSSRQIR
jgi:ribosomal peptide maturation radical SAM protein 1